MIREMERLAWDIPDANEHTPKFISVALRMRLFVMAMDNIPKAEPAGMSDQYSPMPKTLKEFEYLGDLYEKGAITAAKENSKLRSKVNDLIGRNERQRRTIKFLRETGGET